MPPRKDDFDFTSADGLIPKGLPEKPDISFHASASKIPRLLGRYSGTVDRPDAAWEVSGLATFPLEEEEAPASAPAPYVLRQKVGEGGFGEVWEAEQGALRRRVAVKRLREDILWQVSGDEEKSAILNDVFRQEAYTTASLEHPNIVPVHDLGTAPDGRPLLAMKLLKGERWDHMIIRDFPVMSVADFLGRHLPVLIDVAQAVAFAHSRGFAHRDLKPAQVMVGEFGEVVLMDWGIAVMFDTQLAEEELLPGVAREFAPTPEEAHNPSGTPCFMAPEQTRDTGDDLGPWTDIYLLGGVLFFLLTGSAPHQADNSVDSFHKAIKGTVEPAQDRVPDRDVPEQLSELASKALQPQPGSRLSSAKQFIEGIQDYLTGAGNRRESLRLTEAVEEMMERPSLTYQELSQCMTMVERAISLWHENSRAKSQRGHVALIFAATALKNHDLVLARLMGENVEDEEKRAKLFDEIKYREHRIEVEKKQRLVLGVLSGLLLLLVMGNFIYIFDQNRRQAETVKQKIATELEEAKHAEERLKQLESVGGQPGERVLLARLKTNEALLDNAPPPKALEEALGAARAALREAPERLDLQIDLAMILLATGELSEGRGRLKAAADRSREIYGRKSELAASIERLLENES